MKKALFLLMLLVLFLSAAQLWADYRKNGIGVDIRWDINKQDGITTTSSTSTFQVRPVYSRMLNDVMEVAPFLVFGISTEKSNDSIIEEDIQIGAGAGLQWHLLRFKHFRLVTGVSLELSFTWAVKDLIYLKDNTFMIVTGLPLVADIVITEYLSFRAQLDVLVLDLSFRNYNAGLGDQSSFTMIFDTFNAVSDLYFGIFYRFN